MACASWTVDGRIYPKMTPTRAAEITTLLRTNHPAGYRGTLCRHDRAFGDWTEQNVNSPVRRRLFGSEHVLLGF